MRDPRIHPLFTGFTVRLIILFFLYTFSIETIAALKIETVSTTIISIPVLIVFAVAMLRMMKNSGYPWKRFGFTLKNSKKSLVESLLLSLPVFGIIVLYKWAMIQFDPTLRHLSLFQVSAALNFETALSRPFITLLVIGYAIFVPVQEMIYRGAMQNTLEAFLTDKHKTAKAIFISNLPFSLIHIHVSLILTILVYFLGIFWGWLYARERTLLGCTLSHILIGIWAFFIVGISDILAV